jgi:deoxyribose-phosphate aldolase
MEPAVKLTMQEIARMVDLSAVRANDSEETVCELVQMAKDYHCCLVTTLPSMTPLAVELLDDARDIGISGNVGFPSGAHITPVKVAEAVALISAGCTELDFVMNIGKFLSGKYGEVLDDMRAVVETADGLPVKVILECFYLTDDQILKACDLVLEAGAAFVKTGTGWTPTGATLENVSLIKKHVGDAIAIKASGGVRGVDTLAELYRRGATRFGIGLRPAQKIFNQLAALPGHCFEF